MSGGRVSYDRSRFDRAIAAIDAANAADPNRIVVEGKSRPKERVHAELMTAWVMRLDPTASEAQLLAARAHHLRRWAIPRQEYPQGRKGYLQWRTALKRRHAEEVADILAACGYEQAVIDEVARIVRKEGLGRDPAVQVHEDALCLVFLETQFGELADKLGDDHMVEVLVKTLEKMSERGRSEALGLPLDGHLRALVERAVTTIGRRSQPAGGDEDIGQHG